MKNIQLKFLFVASAILPFFSLIPNVNAMGDAPSTCDNRYDGVITSMTISYNNQTFDAMKSNIVLDVPNNQSYLISFTIHTNNQSSQGNNNTGTTWYDTDAYGFDLGMCVSNVGANQDVSTTLTLSEPPNFDPQITQQQVGWSTFTNGPVSYNINWTSPQNQTSQ